MNCSFTKILYIDLAPYLFVAVSQSYLRCYLPGCTPHFAQVKLNSQLSHYATLNHQLFFKVLKFLFEKEKSTYLHTKELAWYLQINQCLPGKHNNFIEQLHQTRPLCDYPWWSKIRTRPLYNHVEHRQKHRHCPSYKNYPGHKNDQRTINLASVSDCYFFTNDSFSLLPFIFSYR